MSLQTDRPHVTAPTCLSAALAHLCAPALFTTEPEMGPVRRSLR